MKRRLCDLETGVGGFTVPSRFIVRWRKSLTACCTLCVWDAYQMLANIEDALQPSDCQQCHSSSHLVIRIVRKTFPITNDRASDQGNLSTRLRRISSLLNPVRLWILCAEEALSVFIPPPCSSVLLLQLQPGPVTQPIGSSTYSGTEFTAN